MTEELRRLAGRWQQKFRCAFRGLAVGIRGQDSFTAHLPAALLAIGAAAVLQLSLLQWGVLLLCIATVLAAELFNTALESLAKAIAPSHHPQIADALDIAAAAVLVTSLGAALVGLLVFAQRLLERLG